MPGSTETRAGLAGLIVRLYRYLRPSRWYLVPVLLACMIEMIFNAQIPLSVKFLIDRALPERDGRLLVWILSLLGAGAVLVSVGGLGRDYLYARTISRVMADLRLRMFEHLQRLSLDYYSRSRVGDVLSRFSNDLVSVNEALVDAVGWGLQPALELVLTTILVFILNWKLALAGVLFTPLCILGPEFISRRAMAASVRKQEHEGEMLNALQENVSAPALIKAYNLQSIFERMFGQRNTRLVFASLELGFLKSAMERSSGLGAIFLQVIVMGLGGYLAFRGQMSVGTFAAFLALFLTLSNNVGYIASYTPRLIGASGGISRIEELLSEVPHVLDRPGAGDASAKPGPIEFHDVTFGYEPGSRNLDGLSFKIPTGASVAFVGPSGSGKSTVLNLVLRFYDPSIGAVTYGGVDLRDLRQNSLHNVIGVVFQDNFLFNMTIRENIALAKPGASEQEIIAASKAAEIHEFILTLPDGYDTLAGERGTRFSGGQRQRLAIARAVLKNPSILVLDEATSALDSATEASINATFASVGRGRTVISVTHRLSSAATADRIFVLKSGRLAEQGTHAELVAARGLYAEMWRRQSGLGLLADDAVATIEPEWLTAVPIFRNVDAGVLREISSWFATEHFNEDRVIIQAGDRGSTFYILVRGKVEVTKASHEGGPIATLNDGDYFGELALINNQPRNATVRAVTPCVCLTLQRDHFHRLLAQNPALSAEIKKQAAARA